MKKKFGDLYRRYQLRIPGSLPGRHLSRTEVAALIAKDKYSNRDD